MRSASSTTVLACISFRDVVASTALPIIVAGGPSIGGDDNTLSVAEDAVKADAAGVAFGERDGWRTAQKLSFVVCGRLSFLPSNPNKVSASGFFRNADVMVPSHPAEANYGKHQITR
jgi:hypothetical protein